MIWGGFFLIGGIAASISSHSATRPGGVYVIYLGAIIYGAVRFLMGVYCYRM